jgi:antitoxin MazE
MRADIVRIGNSKGIRIPAAILRECSMEYGVDLQVKEGKVILTPLKEPRTGWDEAFRDMHEAGKDKQLLAGLPEEEMEDWTW